MADAELRVITGPTAAGKSALAMALAERVPLAILSADSRQIYRDFDIGTAKPSAAERARVPHFGIDLVAPTERHSAAAWAAAVPSWLDGVRALGRTAVVVGGTGFYIRALTAPLFDEPPLDPARRAALAVELAPLATAELRARVERVDPARAHLGRTQLLRALEVATLTGEPISAWHGRAPRAPRCTARYLVVDPGRILAERIAARADAMLGAGWAAEVESLARTVPEDAPAWNASGYHAIRRMVRGELPRAAAIERVVIDTRQYAKRQRTWIRHQLPAGAVTVLDPDVPDALDRALAWWHGQPMNGGRRG